MASLLVLAIILYTVSVNADASQDQLVSVYIHYRHGDRTPLHSFPEDKYFNPTNFPMGYGQLTTSGMQRQYMLGYWLRQRYTNFLPAIYSRDDIYIFATDTDRTLMSAYCCLAALYPPINQQVWNPYILWQPIPVHSRPKKTDIIITNKRPCKRYQKLIEEEKTSAFFNNINKENFKLYSYLSYKSGLNVTDVQKVKLIWGNLHIYYHYNKNFIPKWANKLDTKQMVYLSGLAFQRLWKVTQKTMSRNVIPPQNITFIQY